MNRIIAILLLIAAGLGLAQTIEKPAPFDSAGKVLVVGKSLRDRLGLFPDEKQFLNAKLWLSSSGYTLEINYPDGSRQLLVLTPEQAARIRNQVDIGLPTVFPDYRLDQSGRGLFLLSQLPIALAWYSPAMLSLTRFNDAALSVATYMISAAGFYFGPMLITRKLAMTEAQAVTSVDYGYYGVFNSFALTTILGMGDLLNSAPTSVSSARARSAIMLAVSAGGQVFGYHLGRSFTLGQARYASLVTNCGMVDGFLLGEFVQSLYRENPYQNTSKINAAMFMVGTGVGAYVANRIARQRNWTEGQDLTIALGSLFGAGVTNGVFFSIAPRSWNTDRSRVSLLTSLAIAGNVGGTYLAQRMVAETPLTSSAGFIATGTTIGGGLVGAGIGFLFTTGNNPGAESWRWVTGLATAGTVGGFYLGVKLAKDVTTASLNQGARRVNLDLAALGTGVLSYSTTRTFSAPRLISFSF